MKIVTHFYEKTLSFFVIIAIVLATLPAKATVDVQLNLRYTDPANESAGGTWDLLVQTDSPYGVAGLTVNITGDLGVTGVDLPVAQVFPNSNAFDNVNSIFRYNLLGSGATEIAAGDDLSGTLIVGVGTTSQAPGNAANVAEDDLFDDGIPNNNPWDNSSLIASGTLMAGSARPVLSIIFANDFDSLTTIADTLATIGNVSVRGDSVASDGLLLGDANRDGIVNVTDLGILATNWQQTPRTWDGGNFNVTTDSIVNVTDLGSLATNWQMSTSPSPVPLMVSTVPETSSLLLFGVAALLLGCRRRRV